MATVYGVVQSDGSHCDVSNTERGAKQYATRNGYTQVTARRNGGYDAPIVATRVNGRWRAGNGTE